MGEKRGNVVNMDMSYSREWTELINKKAEFERVSFNYNNNVEETKKKHDLRQALTRTDLISQLSVIQMMGEGYIFTNSIELVIEEVVEIAVIGHEECAGWSGIALNHLSKKKWKNKIIELINFYTDNNRDDKAVFHQSWLLLYKLGFKQALKEYIENYKEHMDGELDDDDLSDIEKMVER